MRWFLRPVVLVPLSAILMLLGAAVVFSGLGGQNQPVALALAPDEQEVAWLFGATNATSWERFVAAVGRSAERLGADFPDLKPIIGPAAFPPQTDAVPEVALQWRGGRLVFRWYKLTSDWGPRDWVGALLRRARSPLAVIGGNNSDTARELAIQFQQQGSNYPESQRPVLILTTATAALVHEAETRPEIPPAPPDLGSTDEEPGSIRLSQVYPGRTFRFCFTNREMALALTHFIWRRDDLRPDADPVYLVRWEDDIYSRDLLDGFWRGLRVLTIEQTAAEIGWATGCVAAAGPPGSFLGGILPLARAGLHGSDFRLSRLPTPQAVDSSVGTFYVPNRFEAQAAQYLLLDMERATAPRRPLLVVTGQAAPTRRFLRALTRTAPGIARRCVIATGDALAFNTIYRDRRVAWPVQDLPFDLVLFSHYNPIDASAGFRPDFDARGEKNDDGITAATGTEDLLLFGDILEGLTRAVRKNGRTTANASELAERLNDLRVEEVNKAEAARYSAKSAAAPFFTPHGNRRGGTGEHIVCLRPHFEGERVLPEATIEVWTWRAVLEGGRVWFRVGEPLPVGYGESSEGGSP